MRGTELLRLIVAQVCLHGTMAGARLAAALLALQQGAGPAAVGVLMALFALTQVFLALPAGRFADRHGLKRPLALACVAASAGAALAAAWPSYWAMCAGALGIGAATGTTVIALQRHVGRAAGGAQELRRVFSWLGIAPPAANFVGPFVAGLAIDHAGVLWGAPAASVGAFRVAFALLALMPLACWLLVRRVADEPAAPPAASATPTRAWTLLQLPMLRRLLFVNWLQSSSWDVHGFAVPLLGHARGLEATTIAAILGCFAVAAAAVRMLLPLLAPNVSERRIITVATLLAAAALVAYPALHSPWTMAACSTVLGLTLGAVQPMVMAMLHQVTPPARHGEALGLRVMVINASSVAMPTLFGSLGAVIGVAPVFWAMGALLVTGNAVVRRLRMPPEGGAPH